CDPAGPRSEFGCSRQSFWPELRAGRTQISQPGCAARSFSSPGRLMRSLPRVAFHWARLRAVCGLLAAACAIHWSSQTVRAQPREADAVAALRQAGAMVTRDEAAPGKPIVGVNFQFNPLPEGILKQLAPFRQLHTLDLSAARISDA